MDNQSVKVVVSGAKGRMGQLILTELAKAKGVQITGGIEHVGFGNTTLAIAGTNGVFVSQDYAGQIFMADVVVIFANDPFAAIQQAEFASEKGRAMVIGTTGFSASQHEELVKIAEKVPVVLASNMSLGVNLLFGIIPTIARVLSGFDVEIVEVHHKLKKDAPSGTALRLGEAVASGTGQSLEECAIYSREGMVGARKEGTIGFSTVRGGDVAGEHTVIFFGEGERVEITHKASTPKIFASATVRAAQWVVGKNPGLYDMQDVLGLR